MEQQSSASIWFCPWGIGIKKNTKNQVHFSDFSSCDTLHIEVDKYGQFKIDGYWVDQWLRKKKLMGFCAINFVWFIILHEYNAV